MTHSTLVRWGSAALGTAALGLGLPALAGAGAGAASAQTAPDPCSSASPTASATVTPTASASATATTTPAPVTTVIASAVASVTSTQSATPTATASPTCTTTASPSATATVTTSPTATATATTTPTSTGSPTATAAPPGPVQCRTPLGISTNRAFIIPTIPVRVTVTGPAGAIVDLQAYSRPSTDYRSVRTAPMPSSGSITFDVVPGTNTRLFAQCVDEDGGEGQQASVSAQRVINVRTALSLSVVRNGTRDYTFQGRILPRRAGQLITLYRVEDDGTRIITSQLRTDASGTYRIRRVFTGSGTFGFLSRTGHTLTNAAGESTSPQRQRSEAYLESGRGTPRPTAVF